VKNLDTLHIVVLLLGFSFMSPNVYAYDCATPSPNMKSVHNAWEQLPAQELTDNEVDRLFRFLKGIVGTWRGTGEATGCFESGNTTEAKKIPQELKLKIVQHDENQFDFNFDVFDTINKMHTQYIFSIKKTIQGLQVPDEGNIALMSESDSGVKFRTQRVTLSSANRGNFRISQESVRELSESNGELMISKAEFGNGVMASFSDWVFNKD
jgi:hypothetical protein